MVKFLKFNLVFVSLILATSCMAANLTDASKPDFDPANFRFEAYQSGKEAAPAIEAIFPVGTSKEYMDKILVQHAGAYGQLARRHPDGTQLFHYKKVVQTAPYTCGFVVSANFNKYDILIKKPLVRMSCDVP